MKHDIEPKTTVDAIIDTYRALIQTQDEITAGDISEVFIWYCGPLEGVEFLLSQHVIQYDFCYAKKKMQSINAALGPALREYALNPHRWEPLLRTLIRMGIDPHAPVPRKYTPGHSHVQFNGYCTALDEVFLETETPFEAESMAHGWLQILSSEGKDVFAYLEREKELHSRQGQITMPSRLFFKSHECQYQVPRMLHYVMDKNSPSARWEWYIDSSSSISKLRREFAHIALQFSMKMTRGLSGNHCGHLETGNGV